MRVRTGNHPHISIAVRERVNAVISTADISSLVDCYVTGVRGVKDLCNDSTIGNAGAGHISGAADQDTANAGRAFLGQDAAAGLANDGPGGVDSDVAKGIFNNKNAVSRPSYGSA